MLFVQRDRRLTNRHKNWRRKNVDTRPTVLYHDEISLSQSCTGCLFERALSRSTMQRVGWRTSPHTVNMCCVRTPVVLRILYMQTADGCVVWLGWVKVHTDRQCAVVYVLAPEGAAVTPLWWNINATFFFFFFFVFLPHMSQRHEACRTDIAAVQLVSTLHALSVTMTSSHTD